ncbi:MAG: hypothetical protein WAL50_06025 [Kineosporiaceae bacterium]
MAWQASFVLLAGIWGCSFWWIKLGLRFLTPVEVAFGCLVLGATALAVTTVAFPAERARRPRAPSRT